MHHLMGMHEVAEMLGVSRQRVSEIAQTDPTFPEPEVVLRSGRVWNRRKIERWAEKRDRRRR